jgi:hypothetical protein
MLTNKACLGYGLLHPAQPWLYVPSVHRPQASDSHLLCQRQHVHAGAVQAGIFTPSGSIMNSNTSNGHLLVIVSSFHAQICRREQGP